MNKKKVESLESDNEGCFCQPGGIVKKEDFKIGPSQRGSEKKKSRKWKITREGKMTLRKTGGVPKVVQRKRQKICISPQPERKEKKRAA